tara:strand:+ start:144 stop:398 length:255 start_codon:yes stop_codon:yes gene_type:complete
MSNELDNKKLVALYQDITIDQMDKFLEKVDDNSNAILNVSIDVHKTLKFLKTYVEENKNLYIENHYECIRRTNKKLNKENKDGR